MSTEANKALVRRLFEEVVSRGNLNAVDELLAEDFVSHEQLPPGIAPGREGVKQLFTMLRGGFPDLRATIEDLVAEGDKVVARLTFSGTQEGEFMGIAASGRRVEYPAIDIFRIVDERVAEHWAVADILGMMQQLGVIPEDV